MDLNIVQKDLINAALAVFMAKSFSNYPDWELESVAGVDASDLLLTVSLGDNDSEDNPHGESKSFQISCAIIDGVANILEDSIINYF
jgi:hypothetical protein